MCVECSPVLGSHLNPGGAARALASCRTPGDGAAAKGGAQLRAARVCDDGCVSAGPANHSFQGVCRETGALPYGTSLHRRSDQPVKRGLEQHPQATKRGMRCGAAPYSVIATQRTTLDSLIVARTCLPTSPQAGRAGGVEPADAHQHRHVPELGHGHGGRAGLGGAAHCRRHTAARRQRRGGSWVRSVPPPLGCDAVLSRARGVTTGVWAGSRMCRGESAVLAVLCQHGRGRRMSGGAFGWLAKQPRCRPSGRAAGGARWRCGAVGLRGVVVRMAGSGAPGAGCRQRCPPAQAAVC